jgi:hypothetical protein
MLLAMVVGMATLDAVFEGTLAFVRETLTGAALARVRTPALASRA